LVADQRVHHAEVAVPALRDRRPERERERGQRRDDEQRHERRDEADVEPDVPRAERESPPAEVREVFVSPVREVQGDHPDEVGDHLGPERQFGPGRGQRAEPDREQEQRRARRADCRPFRFSEKPPHRTRRRRSHGRSYGRYGVRASSPLFGIL